MDPDQEYRDEKEIQIKVLEELLKRTKDEGDEYIRIVLETLIEELEEDIKDSYK